VNIKKFNIMYYKIIIALALALACAMGGGHKGNVNHPSTQSSPDSIGGNSGGDNGHVHG